MINNLNDFLLLQSPQQYLEQMQEYFAFTKFIQVHKIPAYEGQGMLPQLLARPYSSHQCNANGPGYYCSPPEKLAGGVPEQSFSYRGQQVLGRGPSPACQ